MASIAWSRPRLNHNWDALMGSASAWAGLGQRRLIDRAAPTTLPLRPDFLGAAFRVPMPLRGAPAASPPRSCTGSAARPCSPSQRGHLPEALCGRTSWALASDAKFYTRRPSTSGSPERVGPPAGRGVGHRRRRLQPTVSSSPDRSTRHGTCSTIKPAAIGALEDGGAARSGRRRPRRTRLRHEAGRSCGTIGTGGRAYQWNPA
jgi:hypothetical protein